jgi:hypothetical protein
LPFVGQTGGQVFSDSALLAGTQADADFYRPVGLIEAGDRGPFCVPGNLPTTKLRQQVQEQIEAARLVYARIIRGAK